MSGGGRLLLAAAMAGLLFSAGCGNAAAPPGGQGAIPVAASPLETSVVSEAGTWAAVVMGGSAAQHNDFWELFIRPAASARWGLVTPPGTADNGGLVLAAGGPAEVAAFRPSQLLTYTPLSETDNGGRAWDAISPLDARLASTPAALAVGPGARHQLLALTADGRVELADAAAGAWHTLTTDRALAASSASRRCGLRDLTAAAWAPSGLPVLAGICSRPGAAGIFAEESGTWRAIGPVLTASLGDRAVRVLRLATAGDELAALLSAGSGRTANLIAASSADGGRQWTLTPALPQQGATPRSVSFGQGGAVGIITAAGTGVVSAGTGPWRVLPALPAGTATLVPDPGGQATALAVRTNVLTVWRLPSASAVWSRDQVISVPIQYGSSG